MRALAFIQAGYFIITGLWSLVGIRSFQRVTGPKTDIWLVKTVGALVLVVGAVLAVAGARRTRVVEVPLLAGGSAAALIAIDVVYVTRRVISPIYLLDALAESALTTAWFVAWRRGH